MSAHAQAMLTESHIKTLLVDGELADQVWEAWDVGEDDQVAWLAWWLIAGGRFTPNSGLTQVLHRPVEIATQSRHSCTAE